MCKTAKIYIKVNENNEIIDVNSDFFLKNTDGWILIDEGKGDKYIHAQSSYFEKPLTEENKGYNYKYENGNIICV